jgi:hypothetical protein
MESVAENIQFVHEQLHEVKKTPPGPLWAKKRLANRDGYEDTTKPP